jgi:hypothetical protein
VFIKEIGLEFSFVVFVSLSSFGISVIVAAQNEFDGVASLSVSWKSVRSIGFSSLKIW